MIDANLEKRNQGDPKSDREDVHRHPTQTSDGVGSDVQLEKPKCSVFTYQGWSYGYTELSITMPLSQKQLDKSLELSVLVKAELSPRQKQLLADYLSIVSEQIQFVVGNNRP